MMVTKAFTAIAAALHSPTATILKAHPNNHSDNIMSNNLNNNSGKGIICAGLSCLDLQLVGCTMSGSDEAIERYDEAVHCAGGSASMTGTTLALLLRNNEDSSCDQEQVHILTKIGPDFAGTTLLEFYRRAGASSDLVLTDESARTSMAVLPVFQNGKRGCFVNLACNDGFESEELVGQLDGIVAPPRAFLFGYPHLMPKMQGGNLKNMLGAVRQKLCMGDYSENILIGVDLNGVDGSDPMAAQAALIPALDEIDVLHLNEDEAKVLSFSPSSENDDPSNNDMVSSQMLSQIASFHEKGCAVVLLSLGSKGAFVSVTPDAKRLQQVSSCASSWIPGTQVRVPAYKIDGDVNANGAGDALFSGFCLAASSWGDAQQRLCGDDNDWTITPQVAGTFASLVAWQRCDSKTRDGEGMRSAVKLMKMIHAGELPDTLGE